MIKAAPLTINDYNLLFKTAFRAIKAIDSHEDQEYVRQSFLKEASELKREWLAELIEGV